MHYMIMAQVTITTVGTHRLSKKITKRNILRIILTIERPLNVFSISVLYKCLKLFSAAFVLLRAVL